MDYYPSQEERVAAIEAGDTTVRASTVSGDGNKHYAIVRYDNDGDREIARNLTGTAGYAAERIA